jgi:hypothetical protein
VIDENDGAGGNTERNVADSEDEGMTDESSDAASNTEEEVDGSTHDEEGNDDQEDFDSEASFF